MRLSPITYLFVIYIFGAFIFGCSDESSTNASGGSDRGSENRSEGIFAKDIEQLMKIGTPLSEADKRNMLSLTSLTEEELESSRFKVFHIEHCIDLYTEYRSGEMAADRYCAQAIFEFPECKSAKYFLNSSELRSSQKVVDGWNIDYADAQAREFATNGYGMQWSSKAGRWDFVPQDPASSEIIKAWRTPHTYAGTLASQPCYDAPQNVQELFSGQFYPKSIPGGEIFVGIIPPGGSYQLVQSQHTDGGRVEFTVTGVEGSIVRLHNNITSERKTFALDGKGDVMSETLMGHAVVFTAPVAELELAQPEPTTGECVALRVLLKDIEGIDFSAPQDSRINLKSSQVEFFTTDDCSSSTASVVVPEGQSSINFYGRTTISGDSLVELQSEEVLIGETLEILHFLPAALTRLNVTVPSKVAAGSCGSIVVAGVDRYGNFTQLPDGDTVVLKVSVRNQDSDLVFYSDNQCANSIGTVSVDQIFSNVQHLYFKSITAASEYLDFAAVDIAPYSLFHPAEASFTIIPDESSLQLVNESGAVAEAGAWKKLDLTLRDKFGNLFANGANLFTVTDLEPAYAAFSYTSCLENCVVNQGLFNGEFSAGSVSFYIKNTRAGSHSIHISSDLPTLPDQKFVFDIKPGLATNAIISHYQKMPVRSGDPLTMKVSLYDEFGNAPEEATTLYLRKSDGLGLHNAIKVCGSTDFSSYSLRLEEASTCIEFNTEHAGAGFLNFVFDHFEKQLFVHIQPTRLRVQHHLHEHGYGFPPVPVPDSPGITSGVFYGYGPESSIKGDMVKGGCYRFKVLGTGNAGWNFSYYPWSGGDFTLTAPEALQLFQVSETAPCSGTPVQSMQANLSSDFYEVDVKAIMPGETTLTLTTGMAGILGSTEAIFVTSDDTVVPAYIHAVHGAHRGTEISMDVSVYRNSFTFAMTLKDGYSYEGLRPGWVPPVERRNFSILPSDSRHPFEYCGSPCIVHEEMNITKDTTYKTFDYQPRQVFDYPVSFTVKELAPVDSRVDLRAKVTIEKINHPFANSWNISLPATAPSRGWVPVSIDFYNGSDLSANEHAVSIYDLAQPDRTIDDICLNNPDIDGTCTPPVVCTGCMHSINAKSGQVFYVGVGSQSGEDWRLKFVYETTFGFIQREYDRKPEDYQGAVQVSE